MNQVEAGCDRRGMASARGSLIDRRSRPGRHLLTPRGRVRNV